MKRTQNIRVGLALGLLAPLAASAADSVTNRLTFSARFGLNISAKFSGASAIAIPPSPRTTPNGAGYNYDNGYIYPDVSGSGDGQTWYLGYDDSSSQVDASANTILLSRAVGPATLQAPGMNNDPSLGGELTYTRELGQTEHLSYGFEAAINYLNLNLHSASGYSLRGPRETHAYHYEPVGPDWNPPGATPDNPYQGTFEGPGFTVDIPYQSSSTEIGTIANVTGRRSLEAELWGGRLGPYLEIPFDETVRVTISGGLALGLLDNAVGWNENLAFTSGASVNDTGSGVDHAVLWGGYVAANAYWHLSDRWAAAASVQYQNLGNYRHTFGTRKVELDLSNSFFLTLGLSYNF